MSRACRPTGFHAQHLSQCVFLGVAGGGALAYIYWVLAPYIILFPPHRSLKVKAVLPHFADKIPRLRGVD